MANIVLIQQDLILKTTEFSREDGSGLVHHKKSFGSSFEIDWNPDLDAELFTVQSEEQNFVIGYHEVDQLTYVTPEDYYNYLVSLSDYRTNDSSSGGGGGPLKDGEFQVFCDPNDNNRKVGITVDLTDPTSPIFMHFYIDNSTQYLGNVNDLEPCLSDRIEDNLICASDVTLRQRSIIDSQGNTTYIYFGVDGTVVSAPTTYTQGSCEIKKTTEQLKKREELTYIDLTLSSGTGWTGFPLIINQVEWTDGLTPAVVVPIAPTIVNDVAELVLLYNANIAENQISYRSNTSVFISAGTAAIPLTSTAAISFQAESPFGLLFYQRGASWSMEFDAEKSSVNCIEEKITQLVDGQGIPSTVENGLTYSPTNPNEAMTIVLPDLSRERVIIHIQNEPAWIREMAATTDPTIKKGVLVPAGGTYIIEPTTRGKIYQGEISALNDALSTTPKFYITKS